MYNPISLLVFFPSTAFLKSLVVSFRGMFMYSRTFLADI